MYQPMDYVNYGELGVCQITSIGKHPELDPNQTYYTIKPLERPENTIYLPVEKAGLPHPKDHLTGKRHAAFGEDPPAGHHPARKPQGNPAGAGTVDENPSL